MCHLLKQVYYDGNITALRFLYASNAFRSMRSIDIYRQIIFLTGQPRKRYCEMDVQRMDL